MNREDGKEFLIGIMVVVFRNKQLNSVNDNSMILIKWEDNNNNDESNQ